jgi:hypothetical protein
MTTEQIADIERRIEDLQKKTNNPRRGISETCEAEERILCEDEGNRKRV